MGTPNKNYHDRYVPAEWNAICFECGCKFKSSELIRHWQGYYVCRKHWEARHPQDFVRSMPDVQTPPWVQPQPSDVFVPTCTPNGLSCLPGWSVPGCAIPHFISPALARDSFYNDMLGPV